MAKDLATLDLVSQGRLVVIPGVSWQAEEYAALGVPFEKTWSCYQAEERACGACESCRLRLRGFEEAGAVDPIAYRPRRPA